MNRNNKLEKKEKIGKKMALSLAVIFLFQAIYPTTMLALTNGPKAPEATAFEPVTTNNMVNLSSGSLTYNIPVLHVPGPGKQSGYSLSMSYHSGGNSEEESKATGFSWTINPGVINRSKQGHADDRKGQPIKYWQKAPTNRTISVGASVGNLEAFSSDIPFSKNASIRYNNYSGWGYNAGIGFSDPRGVVTLGYNISDGEGSFSLSVDPLAALSDSKEKAKTKAELSKMKADYVNVKPEEKEAAAAAIKKKSDDLKKQQSASLSGQGVGNVNLLGSSYGVFAYGSASKPNAVQSFTGYSWAFNASFLPSVTPIQAGPTFGLTGSYSYQVTNDTEILNAYGYMYNDLAESDENAIMDYHTEKGSSYNRRDYFLGMPFADADNFSISGENIGGGFRMYSKSVGYFKPNHKKSNTYLYNIGLDFEAGLNFGGGGEGGVGYHFLEQGPWEIENIDKPSFSGNSHDEGLFFRFNNDMGGSVSYGSTDKQQAKIIKLNKTPGFKSAKPTISHIQTIADLGEGDRIGRSSYIGYNTNSDMMKSTSHQFYNGASGNPESTVYYNAYEKSHVNTSNISRVGIEDQIGEFTVVNEDGQTYNYGLPVYVRNQKNFQISVKDQTPINNHMIYRQFDSENASITDDIPTIRGEEDNEPYATSYLLTSITDADYIDRTYDGVTSDDWGGYTKFVYKKEHGTTTKEGNDENWYRYRTPYAGFEYSRNSLSDKKDDIGVYSEGEKEVYYLERIETKTHVAIFEMSERADGIDADHNRLNASENAGAKGTKRMLKLDKISLYARKDIGTNNEPITGAKPLQVTMFEYDNKMAEGVKNFNSEGIDGVDGTGKLRLKRMWTEYEGTYNARISPYEFEYEYPDVDYPSKYNEFENHKLNASEIPLNENPAYSENDIGPWGNYMYDGPNRFQKMQSWLSQDINEINSSNYDPAAWQLKKIKLPSGGEIHIQYEQNEYLYVQDKRAHAMVSLMGNNDAEGPSLGLRDKKYYLNTNDIGVYAPHEKDKLVSLIQKEYVDSKRKMYFKFLYRLVGNTKPKIEDCNAEYITGYTSVENVGIDGTGVYVKFDDGLFSENKYNIPFNVCRDFVKTQRSGLINVLGGCGDEILGAVTLDAVPTDENVEKIITNFVEKAFKYQGTIGVCAKLNLNDSYLRIPVVHAKKGGGVRVKRLLMYSPGIGNESPELYGSEYVYETLGEESIEKGKVISSGVATNEPGGIREENILVDFMDRKDQKILDKIISGRDKKEFEGPIGESIMSAPQVTYSKVIVKNIHSGETNTGFMVNEFHTSKDFPFIADHTGINRESDYLPLPLGIVTKFTNNVWSTQGYSFWINSMNGQQKRIATYAGDYNNLHNPSNTTLITEQIYTYFDKDEEIPVMTSVNKYEMQKVGYETELSFATNQVKDVSNDFGLEFDLDAGIFAIIVLPFVSAMPSYSNYEAEMRSHVTTKVTRWPAIQKQVESFADGVRSKTVNVAFSPYTGQPVATRTFDGYNNVDYGNGEHNGAYTTYSIPAAQEYPQLKGKYLNEGKIIKSNSSVTIDKKVEDNKVYLNFSASSGKVCDAMSSFSAGDMIQLNNLANETYHVIGFEGSNLAIKPTKFGKKGTGINNVDVKVLRSGYTNQLNQSVGGFTTYGEVASNGITPKLGDYLEISDPAHPDASEYNARVAFANQLNGVIQGGTVDIPSNLIINPETGECWSTSNTGSPDEQINITNDGDYINYFIGDKDREVYDFGGYDENNPHPFVDSLNSLLNRTWGKEIIGGKIIRTYRGQFYPLAFFRSDYINNIHEIYNKAENNVFDFINNRNSSMFRDVFDPSPYDRSFSAFAKIGQDQTRFYCVKQYRMSVTVVVSKTVIDFDLIDRGMAISDITNAHLNNNNILYTNFAKNKECSQPNPDRKLIQTSTQDELKPFFGPDLNGKYTDYIGEFYQTEDHYLGYNDLRLKCKSKWTGVRFYKEIKEKLCEKNYKKSGGSGKFKIDPKTGELLYFTEDNDCYGTPVECIQFCNTLTPVKQIENVVACNTVTLSDSWNYDIASYIYPDDTYYLNAGNEYEEAQKGKFRTKTSYVYRTDISGYHNRFNPTSSLLPGTTEKHNDVNNEGHVYNGGTYKMDLFNWQSPSLNDPNKWLALNTVTKYSPEGNAVEEQNILGIKSAAKFGYYRTVPYLVAQNSSYESVQFESFENVYLTPFSDYKSLEDGVIFGTPNTAKDIITSTFHSGKQSLKIEPKRGLNIYSFRKFTMDAQVKTNGLQVKFWTKGIETSDEIKILVGAKYYDVNIIAQTGEWKLMEAVIPPFTESIGRTLQISIRRVKVPSSAQIAYIDDIRLQPMDAEMVCYVYDNINRRLLATFDDQHFGVYYVYDLEGKLVRKVIETERGRKTVIENQYNTPRVAR